MILGKKYVVAASVGAFFSVACVSASPADGAQLTKAQVDDMKVGLAQAAATAKKNKNTLEQTRQKLEALKKDLEANLTKLRNKPRQAKQLRAQIAQADDHIARANDAINHQNGILTQVQEKWRSLPPTVFLQEETEAVKENGKTVDDNVATLEEDVDKTSGDVASIKEEGPDVSESDAQEAGGWTPNMKKEYNRLSIHLRMAKEKKATARNANLSALYDDLIANDEHQLKTLEDKAGAPFPG